MKMKKVLTMACAMALTAAIAIGGTVAYLTSQDEVKNTFTVGKVNILLDEEDVDHDNNEKDNRVVDDVTRDKANGYTLLPGHSYDKDPMVTVLKDSAACYVKMTLTYNKDTFIDSKDELDDSKLTEVLGGLDLTVWELKSNVNNGDNTGTLTFWYKDKVPAATEDTALKPLFTKVNVPGTLDNDDMKALDGFEMIINAYAIQADAFESPEEAWAAFDVQFQA